MKYFFLLNGNIPNRPTLASGSCPWLCGMIIETDVAPWLMPAVTLRMRRYPLDHADNHHDDDDVCHDDHDQNGQSSTFDSCSKPSSIHCTFSKTLKSCRVSTWWSWETSSGTTRPTGLRLASSTTLHGGQSHSNHDLIRLILEENHQWLWPTLSLIWKFDHTDLWKISTGCQKCQMGVYFLGGVFLLSINDFWSNLGRAKVI